MLSLKNEKNVLLCHVMKCIQICFDDASNDTN